jgi:steroid delta-isomerase-like uncharacterized protein
MKNPVPEDKAKVIAGRVLRIWNKGNFAKVSELYKPEYVKHSPTPYFDASLEDFINTVTSLHTSFPDCAFTFDEMWVKGDKIVIFATFTGTNTGSFGDLHASGKKARLSGVYIFRIVNGKIAEEWTYFNLLSYYEQVGFNLAPPALLDQDEKEQ